MRQYLKLLFGTYKRAACTFLSLGFVCVLTYVYNTMGIPWNGTSPVSERAANTIVFFAFFELFAFMGVRYLKHKRAYSQEYRGWLFILSSAFIVVLVFLVPTGNALAAAPLFLAGLIFYCAAVGVLLAETVTQRVHAKLWHRARERETKGTMLSHNPRHWR